MDGRSSLSCEFFSVLFCFISTRFVNEQMELNFMMVMEVFFIINCFLLPRFAHDPSMWYGHCLGLPPGLHTVGHSCEVCSATLRGWSREIWAIVLKGVCLLPPSAAAAAVALEGPYVNSFLRGVCCAL